MNTKLIIAVATSATVAGVAARVSSRIKNRRPVESVVVQTDEIIVEGFNAINKQWEEIRDYVNSGPTMARLDQIIAQYDARLN